MSVDETKLRDLAEAGGSGWIGPEDQPAYNALVEQGLAESDGEVDAEGDVFYRITDIGRQWLMADVAGKPADASVPTQATPVASPSPAPTQSASPPRQRAEKMCVAPDVAVSAVSTEIDTDDGAAWNEPYRQRTRRISPAMAAMREAIDFDSLPPGGSRHIAATEAVPEPAKAYERLVFLENKRYATPKLEPNGTVTTIIRRSRKDSTQTSKVTVFAYARRFVLYKAKPDDPRGPGARVKRVLDKDL